MTFRLNGKDFVVPDGDTGTTGYFNEETGKGDGPLGDYMRDHVQYLEASKLYFYDKVCIQAGGAFGLYPILLTKYFKHVYTIEANKKAVPYLEQNCKDYKNITIIGGMALSDESDKIVYLNPGPDSNWGMTKVVNTQTLKTDEVITITIEDITDEYDIHQHVGLIWFDLEGYELNALKGSEGLIKADKPIIGVERPSQEVRNYLNSLGYEKESRSSMDVFFSPF